MIDAVVFDCDGVLVDSETINNQVFASLATQAGVPTTFEDSVRRYMGRATSECVADLEATLGRQIDFDFAARYETEVLRRQQDLKPIPDVPQLLERLRQLGTPICVASSGTPHEIRQRLTTTGLLPYFGEHLYSATMVARGKPEPDLFLLAAQRIGVPPERCLLIEDSPYGVRGGRAAGMYVVGFANLAAAETLTNAGAHHVVSAMGEVERLAHSAR